MAHIRAGISHLPEPPTERETSPRGTTRTTVTAIRIAPARYEEAQDFPAYLSSVQKNGDLWEAMHRLARVPEALVARAAALAGRWKLLALTEDWCGDAVNALPVLARLVEQLPTFELRMVGRDANPDLMDTHLSGTSRSIPVVIVLDEQLTERGWWGPRPTPLQTWFNAEGRLLEKKERYRQMRQWYARDKGRTMIDEILQIAERSLTSAGAP